MRWSSHKHFKNLAVLPSKRARQKTFWRSRRWTWLNIPIIRSRSYSKSAHCQGTTMYAVKVQPFKYLVSLDINQCRLYLPNPFLRVHNESSWDLTNCFATACALQIQQCIVWHFADLKDPHSLWEPVSSWSQASAKTWGTAVKADACVISGRLTSVATPLFCCETPIMDNHHNVMYGKDVFLPTDSCAETLVADDAGTEDHTPK